MKRFILISVSLLALGGLVLGGYAAWKLWPRTTTYYTDAATIRTDAAATDPRDVLWQPPSILAGLDAGSDASEPALSADGRTLVFVRGRAGHDAELYHSSLDESGRWSSPRPLTELNTGYDELGPSLSADGRTLYYYSDRPGSVGGYDIWTARRGESGWTPPANAGPLVNTDSSETSPALSPDGRRLYFASDRPAGGASQATFAPAHSEPAANETAGPRQYDLYVTELLADGPAAATPVAGVNSADNEAAPAVSPYGDFLYFASNRGGGHGGYDLYRARFVDGALQAPENLGADVNTAANELDPEVHLGGFAMLFSSDRSEGAAAAALAGARRPYRLYQVKSREVFRQAHTQRGEIDWAELWRLIAPNLLWAALALLLILLFFSLMRDFRERQIGLLARCLLASLFIHLLLMLLFNVWQVTTALADAMGGRSRMQIALVSTAAGSEIGRQIRGELTDASRPQTLDLAARMDFSPPVDDAPEPAAEAVTVPQTRAGLETVATAVTTTPREADLDATAVAEPVAVASAEQVPAPSADVPFDVPDAASPSDAVESAPAEPAAEPVQTPSPASAELVNAEAFEPRRSHESPRSLSTDAVAEAQPQASVTADATEAGPSDDWTPNPPTAVHAVEAREVDAAIAAPDEPAPLAQAEPSIEAPRAVAVRNAGKAAFTPTTQPAEAEHALHAEPVSAVDTAVARSEPVRTDPNAREAVHDPGNVAVSEIAAEPEPLRLARVDGTIRLPRDEATGEPADSESNASLAAAESATMRADAIFDDSHDAARQPVDLVAPATGAANPDEFAGPAAAAVANAKEADWHGKPASGEPAAVAVTLAARVDIPLAAPEDAATSQYDAESSTAPVASEPEIPRLAAAGESTSADAPEEVRLAPVRVEVALAAPADAKIDAADTGQSASAPAATMPRVGLEPAAAPLAALQLSPVLDLVAAESPGTAASGYAPATPAREVPRLAAAGDASDIDAPREVRLSPDPLSANELSSPPVVLDAAAGDAEADRDAPVPNAAPGDADHSPPQRLAALSLGLPAETEQPLAIVHGRVLDARTGAPIDAAAVRLVLVEGEPLVVHTDPAGQYRLEIPPVPDNFALSASAEGYVPGSLNVSAAALTHGPVRADFRLDEVTETIIALEDEPDVHHLGNDRFEGRVNSQFQRESEGSVHRATFVLGEEHNLDGVVGAEIHLLAKGVQCPHVLRINGHLVSRRLRSSPADGSFGEFRAEFDPAWLRTGVNRFKLTAKECRGDLDDFEFVNVRIQLHRD